MRKWLESSKYGTIFSKNGINIFPFKCPLDEKHDTILKKKEMFHWSDVINAAYI